MTASGGMTWGLRRALVLGFKVQGLGFRVWFKVFRDLGGGFWGVGFRAFVVVLVGVCRAL